MLALLRNDRVPQAIPVVLKYGKWLREEVDLIEAPMQDAANGSTVIGEPVFLRHVYAAKRERFCNQNAFRYLSSLTFQPDIYLGEKLMKIVLGDAYNSSAWGMGRAYGSLRDCIWIVLTELDLEVFNQLFRGTAPLACIESYMGLLVCTIKDCGWCYIPAVNLRKIHG